MDESLASSAASLEASALALLRERSSEPPRLRWIESTASTNSDLLAQGVPPSAGRALLAETQSAGRGRLGRVWHSVPGGALLLSLALPWPGGPASAAGASLAAGLAVAQLLRQRGLDDVGLKWPNDLWLRERKLGGILVEFSGRGDSGFIVVGLGLNLRLPHDFPPDIAAIDFAAVDLSPDRPSLAADLVLALRAGLETLREEGLGPMLREWRSFDCLHGRRVRMTAGALECEGRVLGVADDGGLRVLHPQGERIWYSGEASPRPA